MKKLRNSFLNTLPIVFIGILVIIFFYQFFLYGKIPIPADAIVGLYHPFRDTVSSIYPNGIPVKNPLITDPVRQQFAWRTLVVNNFKKMELPLWNPFSFSGTPLLANFQSAAFYPFNLILLFSDFVSGWSTLVILQPLLAGIFIYLYLRYLSMSKTGSLIGAISFMFGAFNIVWMQWNTVVHVGLWLPLVLLAKEHLITKISFRWILILLVAEISQLFAGHLQIFFYSLVISNIYLVIRLYQTARKQKEKRKCIFFLKRYIFFFGIGSIVICLTSIQWVPTVQFISLSSRLVDQSNFLGEGWFIPWQNLVQFLAPDFFGNPTTGNYWGIWNYAEFVGYVGILPLIFAVYAIIFRLDKKTLFFGSLLFLSLIFALPTPVAYAPFRLGIPFLSTSQPTRLLYIVDFSLSILAALGYDYFQNDSKKKNMLLIFLLFIFFFLIIWAFPAVNKLTNLSISPSDVFVSQRNLIWPSLTFLVSSFLITFHRNVKGNYKMITEAIFLLVIFLDLFRFGLKFLPFSDRSFIFPQTKLTMMLNEMHSYERVMSLDRRILPANFSDFYKLHDVSGYDPLYLLTYNQFVGAWGRQKPEITPAAFNRIVTPEQVDSFLTDLMGVKYLLSYGEIQSNKLEFVANEGKTYLYMNKNSFPRVFLAENIITVRNENDEMVKMYELGNNLKFTAVTRKQLGIPEKPLSSAEISKIVKYDDNYIRIESFTDIERLMILTDVYYPTWRVYVDGKKSDIVPVDFLLRGVRVPAGKHVIEFQNNLI